MNSTIITAEIPVTPILKLPRIEVLDVLRGFALLGIFLMNIEYFNRPFQEFGDGIPAGTAGWDFTVARFTEIFITGKFWVLFSMLFGMGFVVMQTQAALDGRPFTRIYLRRTVALFCFGLLHVLLLWSGDILHSYALAALALLLLPLMTLHASAASGLGFYMVPAFLLLLPSLVPVTISAEQAINNATDHERVVAMAEQAYRIYSSGDYRAVVQQRWQDFMHMLNYEFYVFIQALGVFIMGASIMRSGLLLNLGLNRAFFLRCAIVCALAGAALIGLSQIYADADTVSANGMFRDSMMTMGNLPLSLCYLCSIAYLMSFGAGSRLLGLLAPAGKMALSNYLMQSLIGSLFFYGYGLGLWGQWGRADLAIFVLLVFVLQVISSHLWLKRFRYGPMEWLWRAVTYWTLPSMRITSNKPV